MEISNDTSLVMIRNETKLDTINEHTPIQNLNQQPTITFITISAHLVAVFSYVTFLCVCGLIVFCLTKKKSNKKYLILNNSK